MTLRRCNDCKQIKELETKFYKNAYQPQGRVTYNRDCIKCILTKNGNRNKKNREKKKMQPNHGPIYNPDPADVAIRRIDALLRRLGGS